MEKSEPKIEEEKIESGRTSGLTRAAGVSPEIEKEILIERFKNNPLIVPDPNSRWMNKNVFNCGVIIDDDRLYKMLFRAAWTEDQSMSDCGLAFSVEGTKWYVLDKPVLKCGMNDHCTRGIEDPRIIKWIDGWK